MRVLLALVFLVSLIQSIALLTAATAERNAMRLMETGGTFDEQQLVFASSVDPHNTGLVELLIRSEADTNRRRELIDELTRRAPNRPEGWLHLLRFKLSEAEIDGELDEVLSKLARLAPYEPNVQETVLHLGLRHWLEVSPGVRRAIVDTAVRAMRSEAPYRQTERQALVTNGGLLPLVCAVAPGVTDRLSPEW